MNEPKKPAKKHLYIVTADIDNDPSHYCVRAFTRQQAVAFIANRHITAARAEAEDVLKFGVTDSNILDATVDAAQESLPFAADDTKTAAEALETGPHRITED